MSQDKELLSSLLLACEEGNLEIVKLFIRNNRTLVNYCNGIKDTPLHVAVRNNRILIVEELLECGADPNFKNIHGQTPFYIAKKKNLNHLVEILLLFNAKLDNNFFSSSNCQKKFIKPTSKTTNFGDPSILISGNVKTSSNKNPVVIDPNDTLDDKVSIFKLSPLFCAVLKNQIRRVKELLSLEQVDVNETNYLYDSKTALHVAAEEGFVEIADILLRFGADKEVEDYFNKTPLHLAVWSGHEKVVLLLLDCGASIDHTDKSGNSPLHFCQKEKVLQVLLRFGANINALNISGNTFLNAQSFTMYAPAVLHLEKLKLLDSYINPKILQQLAGICMLEKLNNTYFKPIKEEIEHMKKIVFNYKLKLTVYDFLFLDENALATYAKNKVLKKLYRDGWFEIDFPNYGYLLTLKYKRAIKRNDLLNSATLIMRKATEDSFPDNCYNKIVKFLSDLELRILTTET